MPASSGGTMIGLYLKLKHLLTRPAFRVSPASEKGGARISSLLISLPISGDRQRRLFSRLDPQSWNLSLLDACFPPDPESLNGEEWKRFHAMASRLRPGQRGCFLSHRRAWKRAQEFHTGLTIVLEDDVVPLYAQLPPLPALPRDLDVLYLHHFAQRIPAMGELLIDFLRAPLEALGRPFRLYSIDEVLVSHRGRLHLAAMPGCAYAVTSAGAGKLLSLFDEVGNYYNWDSIMLRHAMSASVYERLLPEICSDAAWFYRGQRPDRGGVKKSSLSLNAYAIYPPLFIHDHRAPSVKFSIPDSAVAGPGER